MPANPWLDQIAIKVNGTDLSSDMMDDLIEVVVDTSLHLPTTFVLRMHDDHLDWMNGSVFKLGAPVTIDVSKDRTSKTLLPLFKGEITAVEPEFGEKLTTFLTIRGYDLSHRMNRQTKTKTFVQVTDSDMVQQVGGSAGLTVQAQATTVVYEHVFQHNQTDLAFLQSRAERIGYELFITGTTLHFRKPRADSPPPKDLEWGVSLRRFNPKLTIAKQVNEVTVKGWDIKKKDLIRGHAADSKVAPQTGAEKSGGVAAQQAIAAAEQLLVHHPVSTQSEADVLAQALLDTINADFLQADGVANGDPELVAGITANITKLGERFSGKYVVTSATHYYSQDGYQTHFSVQGARPQSILTGDAAQIEIKGQWWGGVVPALVTNNKDPDNMGRVKVKYPWLDDQAESFWARLLTPSAGDKRGILWMPEINDEVLVSFEHGEFNRPYVIGGLWNGVDKPPKTADEIVKNGRVAERAIVSRLGHTIRLVEDDGSDEYIEIVDSGKVTTIKLDAKNNKLTIQTKGDMSIEVQGSTEIKSTGSLTIQGQSDVSVEASGQLNLKGTRVNIN